MENVSTTTDRRIIRRVPSLATLERWLSEGIAQATDGCGVEPDRHCEHGCESWLLRLGMI